MNKPLRIALGLVVSSLCVWLIFRHVAFEEVIQNVKDAHKIWFLAILGSMLVGHTLRTFRWGALLSPVKKVPPLQLFMLLTFGFFMNNVLPARGGELLRAYAANRETGIPTSTCLGSIALERLSDLIGLFLVLGIASTVLPIRQMPVVKIAGIIGVGVFVIVLLFLMIQNHRNNGRALPRPVEWLFSFLQNLTAGFSAIKSPSTMASVAFLSLVIWLFEILNVFFAARAFSIMLPYTHAAAVLTGIAVGVMIPAAPGYIGTFEYFGQRSMLFLGYSGAIAVSLIFTLHVFQLIVNSLLGLPGLFKVGWGARRS